jgi:hypothetical protein
MISFNLIPNILDFRFQEKYLNLNRDSNLGVSDLSLALYHLSYPSAHLNLSLEKQYYVWRFDL